MLSLIIVAEYRSKRRNIAKSGTGRKFHAIKGIRSRNEMLLMLDG